MGIKYLKYPITLNPNQPKFTKKKQQKKVVNEMHSILVYKMVITLHDNEIKVHRW